MGSQGAADARLAETNLGPATRPDGGDDCDVTSGARDAAAVKVDVEVVLAEQSARRTASRRGGGNQLDALGCELASVCDRPVMGVAHHLGDRHGIGIEQPTQDLAVMGGGAGRLGCGEQVGIGIDHEVELVAVVAILTTAVTVAGIGVHGGDDPVRCHTVADVGNAVLGEVNVLAGHGGQQGGGRHHVSIVEPFAGGDHRRRIAEEWATSAARSSAGHPPFPWRHRL